MTEQDRLFIEQCAELNAQLLARSEDSKEEVSEEGCYKALIVEKNLALNDVGDALLFAASLNVLNTYVKQSKENKKRVGYSFKNKADLLAKFLNNHPNEFMRIEMQRDKDMSLMVVEICGLQFSFHCVEITANNERYKAKNYDDPELKWDGIRKQSCANTMYSYADESDWRRTSQMLDGSDFNAGMERLLEDYHAGTKTLEDVMHTIYGTQSGKDSQKEDTTAALVQEDAENYPFRNQLQSNLYNATLRQFVENLEERRLVNHVARVYRDGYGYAVSDQAQVHMKYALESLVSVIREYGYQDDAAVHIDTIKLLTYDLVQIRLLSYNSVNHVNVAILCLRSLSSQEWDSQDAITESEKVEKIAEQFNDSVVSMKSYAVRVINNLAEDSSVSLRFGIFYYDQPALDEFTAFRDSLYEKDQSVQIFLAEDRKELYDFLKDSLSGHRGTEAVYSFEKLIKTYNEQISTDLLFDHLYITEKVLQHVEEDKAFVTFVTGGSNTGKDTLVSYLVEQLNSISVSNAVVSSEEEQAKLPGSCKFVIYYKYIPDALNLADYPYHLIIYNPYTMSSDELDDINDLEDEAADCGTATYSYSLNLPLGFSDGGGGNNWLLTHFALVPNNGLIWDCSKYPICVVNSEADFEQKDGIANVVVNESITFDPLSNSVVSSREDDIQLYKALCEGMNGVCLCIKDPALKEYISDSIEAYDQSELYRLLKAYRDDPEKVNAILSEKMNNSTTSNRYEELLIRHLGMDCWKKLEESCREWLISAMYTYKTLESCDPTMDFAGTVLQISKVFEVELSKRLVTEYVNWLADKYGKDEYIDHVPSVLVDDYKGNKKVKKADKTSLGDLPRIMGMDKRGKITDRKDYEEFASFAEEKMLSSNENVQGELTELCLVSDHVRASYRNTAAHKSDIDYVLAKDCVDYCIEVDKKLSWMMGIFAY